MFQAKHNDDQTEVHIYHNHGNVLFVEAAKIQVKKGKLMKEQQIKIR